MGMQKMSDNNQHDTSDVCFPPPLYYLIGLLLGFGIQRFYLIYLAKPGHRAITYTLGGIWIFLGLLLAGWAVISFRYAAQSGIRIHPAQVPFPGMAVFPYAKTRHFHYRPFQPFH